QDLDGVDVDVSAAAGIDEADGVSAVREDRADVGGLPLQGWITGVDGVALGAIDIDIDRAAVGMFGVGQDEAGAGELEFGGVAEGAGVAQGVGIRAAA